ncbi:hypothetical protein Tco_0133401 [Tanacetum coccineum]
MFQQYHGESLSEAWIRFKDLLQKVPHHGIDLWLQVQIFYDHVNCTTRESIDYTAGRRLRKLRPDEAWDTIKKLAQYKNEWWNDAFNSEEVSFNYENPDVKKLLGIMEHKVDTLMKNAISLMGKSKSIFRLTTNEMYQPPTEPSRQEEFEHIVINFIYDQEERIRQLKNYMQDITDEFMEFSSKVALRLKERIKESESKPRKIKKFTKYPDTKVLENSTKHDFSENLEKKTFPTPTSHLCVRYVQLIPLELEALGDMPPHPTMKQWKKRNSSPTRVLLSHSLTLSTPTLSPGHNGLTFFQINEPIFYELAREFFASFEFDATPCRYDLLHKGVKFRLGGVEREMNLLEFGWRVGLYSERESQEVATLSGLRNVETVNATHFTHLFRPTIGDGGYNVWNTKSKSIRNPRIKLAHRCIIMTITGMKETTNRVTEIDLFYLYCIFGVWVVCNIPYWLAKYLKSLRDKIMVFGGMFMTKITQSLGLLTNELVSVLNREPPPYVYKKTSLIKMGVIMKLYEGGCCWPATREVTGEGGGDDEEGNREGGNEGIGGSADIYRNMSQDCGDGVTINKRRRHHVTCDGVTQTLKASNAQVIFDEKKLRSS